MLEKKTHHNNDTYGMIPRTCWHLEHCREKGQPTISKATVSVLHWYGSMKIILHTHFVKTWPVSKETGLFYVNTIDLLCTRSKKNPHNNSRSLEPHSDPDAQLQQGAPVLSTTLCTYTGPQKWTIR